MAVVVLHGSYGRFPGGFLGVEVFFVLSGYLITAILADEMVAAGRISLGRFYIRRLLRLGPALLLGMIVANVLASFAPHLPWPTLPLPLADLATLSYFGNWVEFWSPGRLGLLSHSWSLAVEEQFYIFWPIMFAIGYTGFPDKAWRGIGLAAVALAAATAFAVVVLHVSPNHLFYASLPHAPALLGGAALATYLRSEPANVFSSPAIAGLAVVFLVGMGLRADRTHSSMYTSGVWLVDLACIYLIGHLTTANSVFRRWLSVGPLTGLGRISYGLYLYHFPIFLYAEQFRVAHSAINYITVFGLALMVSVVLALLSFQLLERPFLRLKVGLAAASEHRGFGPSVSES